MSHVHCVLPPARNTVCSSAIYGPSSSALCGGVIEYILPDWSKTSRVWETQLNVRIIAEKLSLHVTVSGSEEILWKLILRLHPENTRYRRGGWSMFQSIYCVNASQFYLVIWHKRILDIHISMNNNGIIYIFQNGAINTWQIALRVSCSSMEIG